VRCGEAICREIHGSVTNVIGLPLAEVLADLQAMGALPAYPPPAFGQTG
jgi:predicted house-cleaning NTP pyrophosphatase (Maf/HAM1 superfamily)